MQKRYDIIAEFSNMMKLEYAAAQESTRRALCARKLERCVMTPCAKALAQLMMLCFYLGCDETFVGDMTEYDFIGPVAWCSRNVYDSS
jgi:hypothetical protein